MIVNMTGSGGVGLNFKVVQYTTTPTGTAAENTIGVVTNTAITSWVMQAEQPTGTAGLVWIEVAAASDAAFFADRKQQVKLYPKVVWQYSNGEWYGLLASIYQAGAWTTFSFPTRYVYRNGNEFEEWTGGWESAWQTGPFYNAKGTVTKDESSITVNAPGDRYSIFAKTVNKIDVSSFKTLTATATSSNGSRFGLSDGTKWNDGDQMVIWATHSEPGTMSLDISAITGEYYVCLYAGQIHAGTYTELKLSIPSNP